MKLFTEAGFISPEGDSYFKEVLDGKIKSILNQATSEAEIRIISSLLHQRIGIFTTNKLNEK
jgi:hypothetical protein